MRFSEVVTVLGAAGLTSAARLPTVHKTRQVDDAGNPFSGRTLTANPEWAEKGEPSYEAFVAAGDLESAGKVRTVQQAGTFFWVSNIASLSNIDDAIAAARAQKEATGEDQIVGLVLYNLPDRDCSAGESAGELDSQNGGMERYKTEYVTPFAEKVAAASDISFAIVLEPDSLANIVTNLGIEFCAQAAPVYQEGIAYAIANLQYDNVHLYLDAAHGGWLGWDDNLAPTAELFASVVEAAKAQSSNSTTVRGVSTNVSNYNPFHADPRPPYTEYSNSWDEDNYALSLAPHLEENGVPAHFIIDQGRVVVEGGREEWGEWCNLEAGFGAIPGTQTDNPYVDALVWIKPGGESDGECGLEGAPRAGEWFQEYYEMLIVNADPSVVPSE